jgi:ferritin-like metal-binding protein YciE
LTEYEYKRLEIAREIGHRMEEGTALLFCGQIQGLNMGELTGGIALAEEARQILSVVSGKLFPLLRIAQMQIVLGQFEEARETLNEAKPDAERNVYELGRVGWLMISVLLNNALDDEYHFKMALETTAQIDQMQEKQLISRQYRMASACHAAEAHLGLARLLPNEQDRQEHLKQALISSQIAVDTYESFGYVNIIECACEEVYLRHSQALAANNHPAKASEYLDKAFNEMMRKYEMIPADSPYRRTYLENIAYHREIRAARMAATLTKSSPRQ